ncbi:MAG: DEAD/DEAH box helicase family protein, partial [Acidimicrobiales bacterium]
ASKLKANLAALEVLDRLRTERRNASAEEQSALARWSGWGSLPKVFDEANADYAPAREQARRLLGDEAAWTAARRTTLNAHYTPAEVVAAMWRAVGDLGFTGGQVLEPGCGSGNFVGLAPDGCEITGVEADATTAAVARHLYGARATIRAERFESFTAPDGHFDLVIGNVPFAKVTPHDPRYNRSRLGLHNYFIVKSLELTRPGGLVAVLTSRYTADARNPAARREIDARADLVGALRFPARAFMGSAGTEVVIDLLVLRRRGEGNDRRGHEWTTTVPAPLDDGGEPLFVNEFFVTNPLCVLGTLAADRGMYRERELTVEATGPLLPALDQALDTLVADARARGLLFTPGTAEREPSPMSVGTGSPVLRFAQEGSFVVADGRLCRLENGQVRPHEPRYRSDVAELRRLVVLRDAARAVLGAQVAGDADPDLHELQGRLTVAYDSYRRAYGPLNRFKVARTGRTDPETGDEIVRRLRPRMGGFRDDPDWPLVAALEVFDDETQQARPAAMFTQRIISPPVARLGVDSAPEAVAVCLDEAGSLDLGRIAELLGVDEDAARAELKGLAWDEPESGQLVPASRYLSGNVRSKLETARAAAADDPRWEANVAALAAVLPRQLEPGEITAGLGAPWVPPGDVEAFCDDVLGASVEIERVAALGRWTVVLRAGRRGSVSLSSEWGTARADAVTLLDASLNQRLHTVTDPTDDGRRVRNDAETLAARDKQDALGARFSSWVWEEPQRASRLAERYNELFNSVVIPAHDGSHLSLPGLAESFRPHPHQRDAVARILTDGRALLAHAVGAGKTATMVMAAMELRRLGLAAKPAVVVPNHMLDQFSREWLQLYPTAKVLIADRDRLSKERRKEFVARCATGDWDAVIFTQAGFGRLPLGRDLLAGYLGEELARSREALSESQSGKSLSVKRLERRIAQLEETYQRLMAAENKDDGVHWTETGVDYIFCDEGHLYKNRRVDSAIEGMANPGSQRAQDLDAKLWALRRANGPRVVTFATATPVANSIAELWTMQSYLQPDVLAEVDLAPFDSWAATFGRTVTALELAPDGGSYRMKTRFARFQNIPELLTLYRQVADVRTAEDLNLPVPVLSGGGPETVIVPASPTLREYVSELAARAERVRSRSVAPDEDNMLKITGDGRRAALDLRLVGEQPDPDGGKLTAAADRITAIFRSSAGYHYLDEAGEPHARPGGVQLVFCDASTPSGKGWNAYAELRALLTERGVPPESVRFIHEAGTDEAKAKLFAACRDGRVAVLVGSTDKMGIGTNVQARAVALHHLDCPWRPADIEQRDGRIVRQGNQNAEVSILRYATEGSFDIYMWQTVERKAAFINQVATGRAVDRDVDDIGDQALSYAEVKALATGNPLILEKASVDAEVAKLGRLRRSHLDDQHRLRRALDTAESRAGSADGRIRRLEKAIGIRTDTRGDRFTMTVGGVPHRKRAEAGEHLHRLVAGLAGPSPVRPNEGPVGELAGLEVHAGLDSRFAEFSLTVPAVDIDIRCPTDEWRGVDPISLVHRLERRIQHLDATLTEARTDHVSATQEAEKARVRIGAPFAHENDLHRLQRRQKEINEVLVPAPKVAPIEPVAEATEARRMADRLAAASARLVTRSPPSL